MWYVVCGMWYVRMWYMVCGMWYVECPYVVCDMWYVRMWYVVCQCMWYVVWTMDLIAHPGPYLGWAGLCPHCPASNVSNQPASHPASHPPTLARYSLVSALVLKLFMRVNTTLLS